MIRTMDANAFLQELPDNYIDLVVTSPPYANQRNHIYDSVDETIYPEWIFNISKELFRVLKPTGSFVLNIKEHVNNGTRSLYVMESVIKMSKLFRYTDTFIWYKTNPFPTGSKRRLKDGFEYCYWFTKTKDYKFYPDRILVPSTSKYLESEKRRKNKGEHISKNQSGMDMSKRYVADMVRPSNVIVMPTDTTNHKHPATFPIGLPEFFIKSMSDENDIVCDIFCGSGTTLLAAKQLDRQYIGCDICNEYVVMAQERLGENDAQN